MILSSHHVMISVKYDDDPSLLAPDPPKLPCLQAHTHGQLGPASQATRDVALATNRAINNYQRLTAFKLEMMATSPPKPKPTAKRLMSPCQFDNSGTDPTFR